MAEYPGLDFVIETQYGCYSGEWCYVTSRKTLEDAVSFCLYWGEEYRVVNSKGEILYPTKEVEYGIRPTSKIT